MPGEALLGNPFLRQGIKVPLQINDRYRSLFIPESRMIQKCNPVAFRRKPDIANPTSGLIKDLSHRKLETAMTVHIMNDRQISVRIEVRPRNIRQQFLWRPACERGARQHSADRFHLSVMGTVQDNS